MFIALEGADNVGKTSMVNLTSSSCTAHSVTKETHLSFTESADSHVPVMYDRIDWMTHMIYRLAMPHHEWNDPRVRTVFSMPNTHLIVKIHDSEECMRNLTDELYDISVSDVNNAYDLFVNRFLIPFNNFMDFELFKSITVVKVHNDPVNRVFYQYISRICSPLEETLYKDKERIVNNDEIIWILNELERNLI